MEKIRCVVERITYKNEENGYTVLKTRVKGYNDLVTVVGYFADVHVGAVLLVDGNWKVDTKYGRQFIAEKWEETLPATVFGIEKYLGSGLIKGIGPQFAKKIVQKFGEDTLDIIENEPDRLIEVEGIGSRRVSMIKQGWQEQKEIKNVMIFLQEHDVSTAHAAKIYKAYGQDSISIVTENPYKLADDIWGIGFKTADTIAQKLGIDPERYIRCRSGIMYTLSKLADEGHCYADREQLQSKAVELLGVEECIISMTLDEMIKQSDVIRDEDALYLPPFYHSEAGTAKRLLTLLSHKREDMGTDSEQIMATVQQKSDIQYDEIQLDAIRQSLKSKVMILTGGPGTGKTTTTLGIISAMRECGLSVLLAAPTGRAAKRMSEATGMEAKTIHRLLEYQPPEGYQRDEKNPLEGDVLIVDECSMIDVILMYNLLKAIPDKMILIMVGDIDQLPSVGAGNVLRDMIDSGVIPTVKLERIFRQAESSKIITNAHRINKGLMPTLKDGKSSDFFFIESETAEDTAEVIRNLCKNRLPSHYKVTPSSIQVLTPMQKGEVGAAALNKLLQNELNPQSLLLQHGGTQYRLNDKVMQIRNNYDKDVFNGDIGIISEVNTEDRNLTVNFDGKLTQYDITELDELVLSYAVTVHKAQGSEYPIVVMPVTMSHYVLLQRNLLYTGITRAKKVFVLVGAAKAIHCAVSNNKVSERNTRLAQRLNGK